MRIRHSIEYYSLSFFSAIICALPRSWALAIGYALGRSIWPLGIRKKLVLSNIRQAFPEIDDKSAAKIGARAAGSFLRTMTEFLRCSGKDRKNFVNLVEVDGIEELRSSLSDTKGAVIITPHLGSWAVYFGTLSDMGIPISLLVGKQHNERVDKFIHRIPGESVEMISKGRSAIKPIMSGIKSGRAIVLVADQHAGPRGILSPLLGKQTSTLALPSMLVAKFDCPIFFMSGHNVGGGLHKLKISKIKLPKPEECDDYKQVITDRFNECIGQAIIETPEQYFWYHRRWRKEDNSPDGVS